MSRRILVMFFLVSAVAACGGSETEAVTTTTETTVDDTSTTETTAEDANAGVVDGYCTLKAELDASDVADPQRLDDLLATTPDEIVDEVNAYVDARRAGDFYASEALDAYVDTHCSSSTGGRP